MVREDDTVLEFVARGVKRDIVYAVRANGQQPARGFIHELDVGEQARFMVVFKHLCDTGRLREHKLKKLHTKEGKAWEFRSPKWRIGAFQDGRLWVLTHGFPKKGQRTPKNEIDMIERIRREHLNQQADRGRT
jgi:phage-related protein